MTSQRYRFARLVALVTLLLAAVGCTETRVIDERNRADYAAAFIAGRVTLPCDVPCSGRWGFVSHEALGYYAAERWAELAELVLEVGHPHLLTFFYLGRAAEELGYPDAAASYYRRSVATADEGGACWAGSCEAFDLPHDAEERLRALARGQSGRDGE